MLSVSPHSLLVSIPLLTLGSIAPPSTSVDQLSPELRASLREALIDSSYGVFQTRTAGTLEAQNPAQGMCSTFTAGGVQVAGVGGERGPWSLFLELEAWGGEDALHPLSAAEPVALAGMTSASGRRIEYRRGPVVEWYHNEARGLEQGFTVDVPPPGTRGEGESLRLALSFGGGLSAEILPGGRDALFLDRAGRPVLHYTGLRAWDAAGEELEASLALEGGRLVIAVETAGARYPVQIDPWIKTEEAKLTASDESDGDLFGDSVALFGNTAVVGAPGDDQAGANAGAAYVFVRSGSTWSEQQKLLGSNTAANDQFGACVAIAGDTAVIGAIGNDQAGTSAGAAYVFVRSGTTWSEEAQLTAGDANSNDFFGVAVALEGDTALVGARTAEGFSTSPGGLAWDAGTGQLFASDNALLPTINPALGFASLVGSIGFNNVEGLEVDSNTGILYGSDVNTDQLLTIDPMTGVGTAVGPLGFNRIVGLAFDPVSNTMYGVDVTSDQLVTIDVSTGAGTAVGPVGFGGVQGLAFDSVAGVLYGSDVLTDQLIAIDPLTGAGTSIGPLGFDLVRGLAFDPAAGILYGSEVSGNQLLTIDTATGAGTSIGPYFGQQAGSTYAYVRSGTSWSEEQKLTASDKSANSQFGLCLALSGDTAVIGSEGDDQGGSGAGAAYVFTRSGTTWSEEQKLTAGDAAAGDSFGVCVAVVGDTAAVGAFRDDLSGGFDQGSVYVFERSGTTWSEEQKISASDGADQDNFGTSVALSGNTILIGAVNGDEGAGFDQGSAYVFVRSGTWLEFQKFIASDAELDDRFGFSVALDVDTALIGLPDDDHDVGVPGSFNGEGSAYVFEVCPAPENYCTAGISASGCQAVLSSSGIPSATAVSGFSLLAADVEGDKVGLFFFGTNGKQANSWGNGTSYQCVVPPVMRGGVLTKTGTIGQCDGAFALDINALWCPSCSGFPKNPGIGATVEAQLWYRDPLNTSNQTTSFSDAIEFCVGP